MRRALNSQNQRSRSSNAESHSSDDGEIKVLELLGEGTFGKVYKGGGKVPIGNNVCETCMHKCFALAHIHPGLVVECLSVLY